VQFLLSHSRLWSLHGGFRRQPCLYYTLLCLAFEVASKRDIEVNVCVSVDGLVTTDAHCWLTRNGQPVYTAPGHDERGYGERLHTKGRITYWLRKARVEPAPHGAGNLGTV